MVGPKCVASGIANVLHWVADQIDPPRPVTDEDLRVIADMTWTQADCAMLHGYADD